MQEKNPRRRMLMEIAACNYCKYFVDASNSDVKGYCSNKKSEYNGKVIVPLNIEKILIGCKEIRHNGKKIRAEIYRLVPKESNLGNLDTNTLIIGNMPVRWSYEYNSIESILKAYKSSD